MNNFLWLEQWYLQQCDGEWEHSFGVTIGTLDNPGWTVRINLQGTPYDGLPNEDQLQDQRRAAKDHRVEAGDGGQRPEPAELHGRQDQSHAEAAQQAKAGHGERETDALEQIRQADVVDEQVHYLTVRIRGASRKPVSSDHVLRRPSSMPAFWISTTAASTASRNSGLSFGTAMPTE